MIRVARGRSANWLPVCKFGLDRPSYAIVSHVEISEIARDDLVGTYPTLQHVRDKASEWGMVVARFHRKFSFIRQFHCNHSTHKHD